MESPPGLCLHHYTLIYCCERLGDYFKEWLTLAKTNSDAARIVNAHHGRPEFELFDLDQDPKSRRICKQSQPHCNQKQSYKTNEWRRLQTTRSQFFTNHRCSTNPKAGYSRKFHMKPIYFPGMTWKCPTEDIWLALNARHFWNQTNTPSQPYGSVQPVRHHSARFTCSPNGETTVDASASLPVACRWYRFVVRSFSPFPR